MRAATQGKVDGLIGEGAAGMVDHLTTRRVLSSDKCTVHRPTSSQSLAVRALLTIGAIVLASQSQPSDAWSGEAAELLSHRAVYELTIDRVERDSGINDAAGVFVFQVQGASCSGWDIVSDIVLTIQSDQGGTIQTETQYRAFEDAVGDVFTFQTQTRTEGGDDTLVTGAAERQQDGAIAIRRFGDMETRSQAHPETLFPNQLTKAMLDAAASGERLFFGQVFDGSHDAGVAQPATAVIGGELPPSVLAPIGASQSRVGDTVEEEADSWADFPTPERAWPVTLSYFDPTQPDSPPNFKVSYTLDTNGVSDNLVLDYGSFSLRGELVDFVAFLPSDCEL